jgi:hypothetical protein
MNRRKEKTESADGVRLSKLSTGRLCLVCPATFLVFMRAVSLRAADPIPREGNTEVGVITVVVEGAIRPDVTLELAERINSPAGPDRVTVQPVPFLSLRDRLRNSRELLVHGGQHACRTL